MQSRIICPHDKTRNHCIICTRKYKREKQALYRANPTLVRRKSCPHGLGCRKRCKICCHEDIVKYNKFRNDKLILRTQGRVMYPLESYTPILEML